MKSERGAMLVMVAVTLLGLLAFSAIVIDYGILWASRGQIQTSADAGALTAAIALAFEDGAGVNLPTTKAKAVAVAKQNGVWGTAPDVQPADVTLVTCPPLSPGIPDTCVKVDAYRNQARSNALPVTLASLFGMQNQGVRATATAQVATASETECLRPWAVLDRWNEYGGPFLPTSTYDKYSTGQGARPPQEDDEYIPPSLTSAGTGFTLPADQGRQFAVKTDTNSNLELSPGWFRAIKIPRLDGMNGGSNVHDNIVSCGGYPTSWFSPDPANGIFDCPTSITNANMVFWAAHGCFAVETGGMTGPNSQGVTELLAKDPRTLQWVGGMGGHIEDTSKPGIVVAESPRIVPLGVINIDHFLSQDPTGSNGVLKVEQIYGFFIEGMGEVDNTTGAITVPVNNGKAVVGRIMRLQGTGASTHTTNSTFLRSVVLVR